MFIYIYIYIYMQQHIILPLIGKKTTSKESSGTVNVVGSLNASDPTLIPLRPDRWAWTQNLHPWALIYTNIYECKTRGWIPLRPHGAPLIPNDIYIWSVALILNECWTSLVHTCKPQSELMQEVASPAEASHLHTAAGGRVTHWWHPPAGGLPHYLPYAGGLETRCSPSITHTHTHTHTPHTHTHIAQLSDYWEKNNYDSNYHFPLLGRGDKN